MTLSVSLSLSVCSQFDWEVAISRKDRCLSLLKETVTKIYSGILATEAALLAMYPGQLAETRVPRLSRVIHFFHAEELLSMFPLLQAKQRETEILKLYGSVFLIGIGQAVSQFLPVRQAVS